MGVTVVTSGGNLNVTTSQKVASAAIQDVWDAENDAGKNTFVDANDVEIITFIDGTLIQLSTEGEAAVVNIESNGGSLTVAEKLAVDACVIRLVATGDCATRDYILYAGFADNSCTLSDWKAGVLAVAFGGGGTVVGETWVVDVAG